MGLEQNNEQHYREVVDKYHDPFASYVMTTRDYVLRPYTVAAPITITLPPVSEAKGRFYSIRARACTMANTITIQDQDESEGWEGDIVLYATGQGCLIYSDGLSWMLRTFADIEVVASVRGQYNMAAAEITGSEAVAGRFRGEARSTVITDLVDAIGVHAQGIVYGDLFGRTVNALYAEAIAKDGSTVTTLRGAMIACDAEGTPAAITTMYGAHIRCKTNVQPTTYRGLLIEHEQFGGLHALMHEYIKIIDSVFDAVDTCASYGLRMLTTGIITTGISLESPMATGIQLINSYSSAGIAVGREGTELVVQAAAPLIEVHGTSTLTTGTYDAVEIRFTQTAAIQTGYVKALRVHAVSDVKTPGSFNAGYFKLDYVTDGYPWGDCAPISSELVMPNNAAIPRGLFTAAELQIAGGALSAFGGGGPLSFIHCNMIGTVAFVDANAYFVDFGGLTIGDANMVRTNTTTATHGIRILIDGVRYDLLCSAAHA